MDLLLWSEPLTKHTYLQVSTKKQCEYAIELRDTEANITMVSNDRLGLRTKIKHIEIIVKILSIRKPSKHIQVLPK